MEIALYIISGVLILGGLVGCILPALPGLPVAYAGILVLHFTDRVQFSTGELIFLTAIMIVAQVLDYLLPAWLTKKVGGSKLGTIGSIVGLIVGLFFPPFGLIIGPFLGAIAGELLNGEGTKTALKSGMGSFLGFILTTGLKIGVCGLYIWYFIKSFI